MSSSCTAPRWAARRGSIAPPTQLEETAPSLPHSSCGASPLASMLNDPTGANRRWHSPAPGWRREEGSAEAGAGVYLSGEKRHNVSQTGKRVAQGSVLIVRLLLVAKTFLVRAQEEEEKKEKKNLRGWKVEVSF